MRNRKSPTCAETQTEVKHTGRIEPTATDTDPLAAVRDTVLAQASENVDEPDVLDGLLWVVEWDTAMGTITGPGRMVDFADYNGVRL